MIAIYARQSVERADSISVETQIARCKARLPQAEAEACEVFADRGFSGKDVERPALQALLRAVEEGRVQKLLVYKLDRVSRSVHDFTGLCGRLREKGVAFQSCEDGLTLDDSPAGAAMAQIMMVFAEFERETIVRRVTDNYYARAGSGMYLGGRPPFGFLKGETVLAGKRTACYVPDPDKAALVRELYARYLEPGASLGSLMRWLNLDVRVPTGRGNAWSTAQLGRLLRSPAYVRADAAVYRYFRDAGAVLSDPPAAYTGARGAYLYASPAGRTRSKFCHLAGAFVTLAPHEGLVDAADWLAVQQKLARGRAVKNSGRGSHSWLSGRMKCAGCGYAVTVVPMPGGADAYLNCGGRKKGKCPGRGRGMTLRMVETAAEDALLRFLRSYADLPLVRRQVRPDAANRRALEMVALEEEIARLTRNLARIEQPDVLAMAARELHRRQQALEALERKQREAGRPVRDTALEQAFARIPDEWPGYSLAQKKRIAHLALQAVVLGEGTAEIVFAAGFGDVK